MNKLAIVLSGVAAVLLSMSSTAQAQDCGHGGRGWNQVQDSPQNYYYTHAQPVPQQQQWVPQQQQQWVPQQQQWARPVRAQWAPAAQPWDMRRAGWGGRRHHRREW